MVTVKRAILVALSFALAAVAVLSLFLPFSAKAGAAREEYVCKWENGAVTVETYSSAYPDLVDCSECSVTLLRESVRGEIAPSVQFSKVVSAIFTGGLAELLSLGDAPLTRLERVALWRMTRGRVWYSGGYFVWGEHGLYKADSAQGETLVLLSGPITAARLKNTGAKILELRSQAVFRADVLAGTAVQSVTAYAPYSYESGAVYLDTGIARRLIAGMPALTSLTVAQCDYADEGCLRACTSLQSLTLPFAGNTPSGIEHDFHGELAYLFSDGTEYFVPASLKRVKITGGVLVSHAFYRCGGVEEIDLCGMLPENIHTDALADCTNLRLLHSPNAQLRLAGRYSTRTAPCGCTMFERIG